jgi:uncharacterized oxidoreductase
MVDVLAGALTQAGCPRTDRADDTEGGGLLMLAIDVRRFAPLEEFLPMVREMAGYIKSSRPAPGFDAVLVPGEWEFLQRRRHEKDGIEIPDRVWTELKDLANRLGVANPQELSG